MHEMSIAEHLIQCVLDAAEGHHEQQVGRIEKNEKIEKIDKIEKIVVEIGLMRQVVGEAMEMAFRAVSEGTIAQGAELEIIDIAIEAKCRKCGHTFNPTTIEFLCPQCRQADVEITAGNDIILKSVQCTQNTRE